MRAAPETIDCIRAPSGIERSGAASIAKTNAALGITKCFLPATAQQVPHLAGAAVPHPAVEAVQARHAALRSVGFAGVEEPTEE